MNEKQIKLVIGCLLHDFGKLLYRAFNEERKKHSLSGYEYFLNNELLKEEKEILDCIRYHHAGELKKASVDNSALCYIAYIADNISACDRRRKEDEGENGGFVRDIASESIFNILNGARDNKVYSPDVLSEKSGINFPVDKTNFSEEFYSEIVDNIRDALKGIAVEEKYINSLLQLLESNLTFIPSSTQTGELRDISLYDHLKLTAAFGLCIESYLEEKGVFDYREALFKKAEDFYKEKAFAIFSMDMSGIQDFIYNISSKFALKGLRARSFYLEILLENTVDELLTQLGLCRANVLYTGGGHTYILIPATDCAKKTIESFERSLNDFFISAFGNGLYAACGYAECSSEDLKNNPDGSYKEIFHKVSTMISEKKLNRYTAAQIIALNGKKSGEHSQECAICHRSDRLKSDGEDNICSVCSGLKGLSDMIIGGDNAFFAAMREASENRSSVPLPFGQSLTAYGREELRNVMESGGGYVRAYSKNKPHTGAGLASNLWVGDYALEREFLSLAEKSGGVNRIAVIRADVDNLGQAFVGGFEESGGGKYETVTRTSVFSRKLSEFFKLHINEILQKGRFSLFDKDYGRNAAPRNAVIVYSGGDDLFVVGGWDDIIGFAVDLYRCFGKFSQGTLTLSAGIGIFQPKHPIYDMAERTGRLEDCSKGYVSPEGKAKNAVTLFDETGAFSWDELIDDVIGEKLTAIKKYIDQNSEHGKALLYNMLELIRKKESESRLNIARFAYLIARLRPANKDDGGDEQRQEAFNEFSEKMYNWIQDAKESRKLVTAIYIYVYMNRDENQERKD